MSNMSVDLSLLLPVFVYVLFEVASTTCRTCTLLVIALTSVSITYAILGIIG